MPMLRSNWLESLVLVFSVAMAIPAYSRELPEIGDAIGDFELTDQSGRTVRLSDFEGKTVVLEWTNPDCPFVKRHYEAKTMRALAERYADRGVVWLAVISTHYMKAEGNAEFIKKYQLPYPVLMDPTGAVGKRLGARTTPHMYVVDAVGRLAYVGAIDDDPRGKSEGSGKNYVADCLEDITAGRPVRNAKTKPYGCSVKYAKR